MELFHGMACPIACLKIAGDKRSAAAWKTGRTAAELPAPKAFELL